MSGFRDVAQSDKTWDTRVLGGLSDLRVSNQEGTQSQKKHPPSGPESIDCLRVRGSRYSTNSDLPRERLCSATIQDYAYFRFPEISGLPSHFSLIRPGTCRSGRQGGRSGATCTRARISPVQGGRWGASRYQTHIRFDVVSTRDRCAGFRERTKRGKENRGKIGAANGKECRIREEPPQAPPEYRGEDASSPTAYMRDAALCPSHVRDAHRMLRHAHRFRLCRITRRPTWPSPRRPAASPRPRSSRKS